MSNLIIFNNKYSSREEKIRTTLTRDEVINLTRTKYPFVEYDFNNLRLDVWDQFLICESLTESMPITKEFEEQQNKKIKDTSVNGMNNDSYKNGVIFELTQNKQQFITELNSCNYRTPPIKISILLEKIFKEWKSKQGHWLYIAQHWSPRAINRTIKQLTKLHNEGRTTIKNPPAYFTWLIKFRKQRQI